MPATSPLFGIPQKPAEFTLVVLFAASGPAMAMAAGFPRVSMSRHTGTGRYTVARSVAAFAGPCRVDFNCWMNEAESTFQFSKGIVL